MASRLALRLVLVVIVFLFVFEVALQPVRFEGWTPVFQKPGPRVNLGLDLQGGTHMLLEARSTPQVRATPELVDAAMRIIANRIDQLGVVEPTVQRQGTSRIIIELPGIHEPQRAIDLIGKTALLEFVDTATTSVPAKSRWSADGKEITLPDGKKQPLEKKVIFAGKDLANAQASIDETEGAVVNFQMTGEAARRFEEYTGKNIGRYLTIVLDNEVISSPVIRSAITGGRGQISGGFRGLQEARDLAVLLRGGALPVPVEIVERRSVGPTLGRDSLDASLK
ncbi:MAG: hypothetical protein HY660_03425, partial [Armatimonadetes bacterium]|nr:hypothetical protein [Armatimonadota bacterium]